ncbi:MAG TPA: hypothetical protein VI298_08725 [Geobacteraceae bacterium]
MKIIFVCAYRENCPIFFRWGKAHCNRHCDRLKEKQKGYGSLH